VIRDVAATPDGKLVIAASALSSNRQLAAVMLWLGQAGQIERVVRTSPFFASHIAVAADGTLWAADKVGDAEFKDTQPHEILRQYDQQGRQVANGAID